MALEMLVALNVVDEEAYRSYRNEMSPILGRYGGGFGYDFQIAEVLKAETDAPINRVFTIYFSDEAARDAFFADDVYLQVRQRHFEHAVTATTIIATYER